MEINVLQYLSISMVFLARDLHHAAVHANESLGGGGVDFEGFVVVDLDVEVEPIFPGSLRDEAGRNYLIVLVKFHGVGEFATGKLHWLLDSDGEGLPLVYQFSRQFFIGFHL